MPLDRRTFLAASVSMTAIPLIGRPGIPELLACDRCFASSLDATLHAEIAFFDGDVTALWRDRLEPLWRTGTASVGGITSSAALFCLEQLARGHGRKVSMRQPIAGTNAVRWVISPVSPRGFA
jgi:hypothetical protein